MPALQPHTHTSLPTPAGAARRVGQRSEIDLLPACLPLCLLRPAAKEGGRGTGAVSNIGAAV